MVILLIFSLQRDLHGEQKAVTGGQKEGLGGICPPSYMVEKGPVINFYACSSVFSA